VCLSLNFSESPDPSVPEFNFCAYNSEYLKQLSDRSGNDLKFIDMSNDFEKSKYLCAWAHSQWQHNGYNTPFREDPVSILSEAKEGKRFRCVEYSIILHAILCTVGIKGRVLYLRTEDVESRKIGAGHVVVEAFTEMQKKWIMFDPQNNAYAEAEGMPLNALELGMALENAPESVSFPGKGRYFRNKYIQFIRPYLYYFHTDIKMAYPQNYPRTQVALMPIGSKVPEKFQGIPLDEVLIPTNSYSSFYPGQDKFHL
jgi:hypothetical protein